MKRFLGRLKVHIPFRFAQFAWGVLVYMLFVILWGAVVRASGSGDGCGKHWPFCGDHLVPAFQRLATLVEYSHRVSTGLMIPLIGALGIWAYSSFGKGHLARKAAAFAVLLTITEGAFGALLVLRGLVTVNDSPERVVIMAVHLLNTLLLLMSLALTAWWGEGAPPIQIAQRGEYRRMATGLGIGLLAALLVAASGAIAALADTLYPVHSLAAALDQDLHPGGRYLIQLRLLHPIISTATGIYSVMLARYVVAIRPTLDTRRFARYLVALVAIEIVAGVTNLALLAPMGMQLLHLLLADLLWITLVLLTVSALAKKS